MELPAITAGEVLEDAKSFPASVALGWPTRGPSRTSVPRTPGRGPHGARGRHLRPWDLHHHQHIARQA
eukprot:1455646-Pyramimonas_sp.AAC.1